MKCENLEPKLLEYLDGELALEERQQLEEHLAHCETCSTRLASYMQQDQLLKRYFDTLSQVPLTTPRPQININKSPAPRVRFPYQLLVAASFLGVVFLVGLFTFLHYRPAYQSKTDVEIGTATKVMGKVQYFDGNKLQPVIRGMKITSRTRLKIPARSYLEVKLLSPHSNKEDNIIEFKDNTLASFNEFSNRIELALEQGEVWVHLNQKPPKPLTVKTRNLVIHERGTIFNVAQGITGTAVGVVIGSVEFTLNGNIEIIKPAQFFTTFENKSGDNLYRHILWSHYREKLLALLPKEQLENSQLTATAQLLQVPEAPPKPTPTPAPSASEFCTLDTTE
ncbi:MAG: FecR domain-containing protein, partial [Candidatus Sumerlaeia bacterium]|nr:FecR domain-containing protein [Candidatus Sumerlaeia bacterium]